MAIKSIGIRSYRNVQRKTNNNSFPLVRKGKERLVIVDRRVINKKKKKKKEWDDARRIVAANSSAASVRENA